MSSHTPAGYPVASDTFAGGASLTKGGASAEQPTLDQLLNNLERWVMIRGVVNTPADLPIGAEDGWIMAVRETTGPGTPPGAYIFNGDTLVWMNLLNTGLPANHKTTHQLGGADVLDVAGLSGELADQQKPKTHRASHEAGSGVDEISIAGLSGIPLSRRFQGVVNTVGDLPAGPNTDGDTYVVRNDPAPAGDPGLYTWDATGPGSWEKVAGGGASLGDNIFVAAPNAAYLTVQSAVDAAVAAGPSEATPKLVLVAPGFWNEDVLCRRSCVHFQGLGGQGVAVLNSLTFSECTVASINNFNASGNPADLVLDATLVDPPWRNQVRDIECERRNALTAWTGFANGSFRCLSRGNVTGGRVGRYEILSWRCVFRNATGVGGKAVVLSYTQYISFYDSWVNGDLEARQCAGIWGDNSDINGTITIQYDSTLPKASGGNLGLNGRASRFGAVVMSGRDAKVGVDYMLNCSLASYSNSCTNVASTTVLDDCSVKGAISIANAGPVVTNNGGTHLQEPTGTGAVGWTDVPGFGPGGSRMRFTPEGGLAVKLTNNSGAQINKGSVVKPSLATDDSIVLTAASDLDPVGIVYAVIPNGATGWVVVSGRCEVLIDNVGGCNREDWLGVSTATAGQATAGVIPAGIADHMREIGHTLRARANAGLVFAIVHFN